MSENIQLVSFYLEAQLYGIDIRIVKEINPLVSITQVPRSAEQIRGLVNIRGQVVLVMDLAVIFGRQPREITEFTQIIILKTASELKNVRVDQRQFSNIALGDKPLGFIVDKIRDVTSVPLRMIEPVPPHIDHANSRYFDGVVGVEDELQMILDAREVLSWDGTHESGKK